VMDNMWVFSIYMYLCGLRRVHEGYNVRGIPPVLQVLLFKKLQSRIIDPLTGIKLSSEEWMVQPHTVNLLLCTQKNVDIHVHESWENINLIVFGRYIFQIIIISLIINESGSLLNINTILLSFVLLGKT